MTIIIYHIIVLRDLLISSSLHVYVVILKIVCDNFQLSRELVVT